MKVLASSVIRSTHRGDSHGGLYIVDLESEKCEQVLDWNYEKIRWEGKGGDRGLRGLAFYNDKLYAAGANELFVFNKNFELIEQYTHPLLDGTHEIFIYNNQVYNIANVHDVILVFDIASSQWVKGYYHQRGGYPQVFFPSPDVRFPRYETMHLNSVQVYNDWMYYSGTLTESIHGIHIRTHQICEQPIYEDRSGDCHNAQLWRPSGTDQLLVVYSRAKKRDTRARKPTGEIVKIWPTKLPKNAEINNRNLPGDHALLGFTRGMVLTERCAIVGTSPAAVMEFSLDEPKDDPVSYVQISMDLRNSICGITRYEW